MEMGEGDAPATYRPRSSKLVSGSILPELDIYLHLLVLLQQIDSSKLDKVIYTANGKLPLKLIFMISVLFPGQVV